MIKKFELTVKQEIQNFNRDKLAITISVNNLKREIAELRSHCNGAIANLKSEQKKRDIEADCLLSQMERIESKLDRHIADQSDINERNARKITEANEYSGEMRSYISKEHKLRIDNESQIRAVEKECKNYAESIGQDQKHEIKKVRLQLRDEIKEVRDRPSEIPGIKDDFERRLSSHRVDVEGVGQELDYFKREFYIVEKKIENIYTLIDRLKSKE